MLEPSLNYVNCPDTQGGHRMAYWQWGNPTASHVIVCCHGLTRQGRDFDVLARALCAAKLPDLKNSQDLRVVCPDVVGRGQSDWFKEPMNYQLPMYAADMLVLLAQLQATVLDWVGTSMGGLIGMILGGQPDLPLSVPIRKLILNDVGPVIEWQAIQRIGQYLGKTGHFSSEQQAADAMWAISSSFGPHTPEQWLALSKPMLKPIFDADTGVANGYTLHYDPALAIPFNSVTEVTAQQGEDLLWALYDNIKAQTLVMRGAESDLLSRATTAAMALRGPRAQNVEFQGVGHAPTLITDNQTQAVIDFLLS